MNNEQLRISANLAVLYDEWVATQRARADYTDALSWKRSGGRRYLYRIKPRSRIGHSLGAESAETVAFASAYSETRERLDARLLELEQQIRVTAPLYRAVRLPLIAPAAGALLRQADINGLLGTALMVVGTLTMPAYEMEAQQRFATGLDATEDCDLTWTANDAAAVSIIANKRLPLTSLLKSVDATYTVNQERTFQYRNSRAFEIEVLAAPDALQHYPPSEPLRPLAMPSQAWLLGGRPVTQVVMDLGGKPVRIVAPDPRLAALHKRWLSNQPDRDRKKAPKDRQQATALAKAVINQMPHYPVDERFVASVPQPLKEFIAALWPLDARSHRA